MLVDGSKTCKEHINSIEDLKCTPFEAIFTGTACNKNTRGMSSPNVSNFNSLKSMY